MDPLGTFASLPSHSVSVHVVGRVASEQVFDIFHRYPLCFAVAVPVQCSCLLEPTAVLTEAIVSACLPTSNGPQALLKLRTRRRLVSAWNIRSHTIGLSVHDLEQFPAVS